MLQIHQIKENIYCFRGLDRTHFDFHGSVFKTTDGASYMAYLVIDKEITLIDTMDEALTEEFKVEVLKVLNGRKIDNIIINHVEPDHSFAYEDIKDMFPEAKTYCSKLAAKALKNMFFKEHTYTEVDSLETINTGKYNFTFALTPFIHWPDNMITYLGEEKILFSNDAFGSLVTGDALYDDEYDYDKDLFRHCKEYYANIVMPCSKFVAKRLPEILGLNLPIEMVCPSHGIIWRKDIIKIITQYLKWANFEEIKDKVVIVYDTIWDSTHKVAKEIASGLEEKGIEVSLYRAKTARPSEVITDIMDAKAVLIGSSNFNNTMVPTIADILERMIALKPQGKIGMSFGSFGWVNTHLKRIDTRLEEAGINVIEAPHYENFRPDEKDREFAKAVGENLAKRILEK